MLWLSPVGETVGQEDWEEDREKHFKFKDTNRLEVKHLEEICYANSRPKRVGVSILILVKIDFKTNLVTTGN